jgi:hypothetical protein
VLVDERGVLLGAGWCQWTRRAARCRLASWARRAAWRAVASAGAACVKVPRGVSWRGVLRGVMSVLVGVVSVLAGAAYGVARGRVAGRGVRRGAR